MLIRGHQWFECERRAERGSSAVSSAPRTIIVTSRSSSTPSLSHSSPHTGTRKEHVALIASFGVATNAYAAAAAAAAALVATPKLEMSATCSLRVPVCGLEWLSDGVLLLLDVTMMVRGALETALEPRSARRSHSNH